MKSNFSDFFFFGQICIKYIKMLYTFLAQKFYFNNYNYLGIYLREIQISPKFS